MARITLPTGTPAELVRPDGVEPSFGLVVLPDIWGLRPLFDDLVARLSAEHGWAVCAPEPFRGQVLDTAEARFAAMSRRDDDAALADIVAAADATRCERVGLVGFCMGGMYALKAAGLGRFAAVVSFYGMIRVPADWRGDGQGEPLEYLARPGASPVLAVIGGRDTWTPPADVAALATTGARIELFAEGEHGFVHDPSRPTHRAADAATAWQRAIEFLSS